MPVGYDFVGWDVVDEFDVVWKFLNGGCRLFVLGFGSSLFLILGSNLLIFGSSFINFSFNLPFFGIVFWYFFKRFEFRCVCSIFELRFWTIWLSTLKEPSWVRIFIGRFELRIRTSIFELRIRAIWLSTLKEPSGFEFLKRDSNWEIRPPH